MNRALIYLDLSNNNISKLYQRSFEGLSKLETLIISNNSINHTAIPVNILKPLVSLLHLAIKQNFNHSVFAPCVIVGNPTQSENGCCISWK